MQFLQFAQHVYEFVGVAAVQTDARLIKNIYRSDELTAKICCEVNALTLATTQCV